MIMTYACEKNKLKNNITSFPMNKRRKIKQFGCDRVDREIYESFTSYSTASSVCIYLYLYIDNDNRNKPILVNKKLNFFISSGMDFL